MSNVQGLADILLSRALGIVDERKTLEAVLGWPGYFHATQRAISRVQRLGAEKGFPVDDQGAVEAARLALVGYKRQRADKNKIEARPDVDAEVAGHLADSIVRDLPRKASPRRLKERLGTLAVIASLDPRKAPPQGGLTKAVRRVRDLAGRSDLGLVSRGTLIAAAKIVVDSIEAPANVEGRRSPSIPIHGDDWRRSGGDRATPVWSSDRADLPDHVIITVPQFHTRLNMAHAVLATLRYPELHIDQVRDQRDREWLSELPSELAARFRGSRWDYARGTELLIHLPCLDRIRTRLAAIPGYPKLPPVSKPAAGPYRPVYKFEDPLPTPAAEAARAERDTIEAVLKTRFGNRLIPVGQAWELIRQFKNGNFALSEAGMMLYANGYNLRGTSSRFPEGMIYSDGNNLFGLGYFAKEGKEEAGGHLMVIAPTGRSDAAAADAVVSFIRAVRKLGISRSIYIRHLSEATRDVLLERGLHPIETDPWHPDAPEEDEHQPNRVFRLKELLDTSGTEVLIKHLICDDEHDDTVPPEKRRHHYRKKNHDAHRRFNNFLKNNELTFTLDPYRADQSAAKEIVETYFRKRSEQPGVVGSTAHDYFALVNNLPHGINGRDYFAYLGHLNFPDGKRLPLSFFVGERVSDQRAALYATLTMRFPDELSVWVERQGSAPLLTTQGFTAIPQYAWLEVFAKMHAAGVQEVDGGGSETEGLDDMKRQLGGRPEKSHWVVSQAIRP